MARRFFEWREAWTLGIAAMDADHRQLAALLDRIGSRLTACPEGIAGPVNDALSADLALLGAQTRVHFRREEDLMRRSDYPGFHHHMAEHDLLLAEYTVLTRELATGAAGVLDLGVLAALKAWFLGHLLDDDRRLAAHLHEIGVGDVSHRDPTPGSLPSARPRKSAPFTPLVSPTAPLVLRPPACVGDGRLCAPGAGPVRPRPALIMGAALATAALVACAASTLDG